MTRKPESAPRVLLLIAGAFVYCAATGAQDEPWQWRPIQLSSVDAATSWNYQYAYFFRGSEYSRYAIKANKVDAGYPKSIKWHWRELWSDGVDAAVNWGGGKVLFFKGDQYIRYDTKRQRTDAGYPKRIAANWPGLWASDIDAAVKWGHGKLYFFKGAEYIRYDMKANKVDAGYPKAIEGNWPGVWTSGIDAAVNWGDRIYFFKGNEYLRFNKKKGKTVGQAKLIDGGWPDLFGKARPATWSEPHQAVPEAQWPPVEKAPASNDSWPTRDKP
jgi:hypothetical protein